MSGSELGLRIRRRYCSSARVIPFRACGQKYWFFCCGAWKCI